MKMARTKVLSRERVMEMAARAVRAKKDAPSGTGILIVVTVVIVSEELNLMREVVAVVAAAQRHRCHPAGVITEIAKPQQQAVAWESSVSVSTLRSAI